MPADRDISESADNSVGGWFSFLSMAGAELRGPVTAAMLAAIALLLLLLLRVDRALPSWLIATPALAYLGSTFWGWIASYSRLQALKDYPLSKIASTPQGYVRLEGRAAAFPGKPLECPLTHRACCWYSYKVIEQRDDRRNPSSEEHDTSDWSFMINDGSGECVIDPAGARLVTVRAKKWRDGNFYYTERIILPGDPLFVLGEFTTAGSMVTDADVEFQMGRLIAEWKMDMPALIKRFDLDGSGRISEQAWERVRAQARRDVEGELARNPPQPQNQIGKPGDDRPFIISAAPRRQLERDTTIWAWIHLSCLLLGVTIMAGWFFRH